MQTNCEMKPAGPVSPEIRFLGRRRFARHFLSMAAIIGAARSLPASSQPAGVSLAQASDPSRAAFLARALALRDQALREGDQPFGAVVVRQGRIVGEAASRVVVAGDPTAHAEMEAIRDACRKLGTRDLSGSALISSSRPCRMCETAAFYAHVGRMFFGETQTDAGAPGAGC
jgi:tRNA(Arg) A34 adenosine deaminase TadA